MCFYLLLNQWNKVLTDWYKLFKFETYKILLYLNMKYSVEFENYILKWNSCLVFSYFWSLEKVKQNK